ncbi:MAG: sigma-70 family RNA polymerase sigma factor, partial [Armatimonadota bacterium]
RAKSGDVGAYGVLVRRYQSAVCGIVSRMVANSDDVDDIVQEVFVVGYRCIGGFRGDSQFSTWIYRVAVNTAIKQMKRIKVRQAVSIDDPDTGLSDILKSNDADGPERATERRERDEALRKAVLSLPEKHRAVVVLHYFQDLTCEEVANVIGCSVGTVWSRLHYACKKLQGQMAGYEF